MKKEVDFIAEFEKEEAELNNEKANPCPPTKDQYQKMRLGIKLVELKRKALGLMDKHFLLHYV